LLWVLVPPLFVHILVLAEVRIGKFTYQSRENGVKRARDGADSHNACSIPDAREMNQHPP
jgi:hypothetical protein